MGSKTFVGSNRGSAGLPLLTGGGSAIAASCELSIDRKAGGLRVGGSGKRESCEDRSMGMTLRELRNEF